MPFGACWLEWRRRVKLTSECPVNRPERTHRSTLGDKGGSIGPDLRNVLVDQIDQPRFRPSVYSVGREALGRTVVEDAPAVRISQPGLGEQRILAFVVHRGLISSTHNRLITAITRLLCRRC